MQNRRGQQRKQSNEWLGEDSEEQGIPVALADKLLGCQKHSPKQQRTSPVEKTQRIKKPKKPQRNLITKEEAPIKPELQTLQDRLVCEAVNRLRMCPSTDREQTIPIFKHLTRQRLIDFLQRIEQEYNQTAKAFLSNSPNQRSCGNLKSLLLCFIDQIASAFPVLNNIVYQYAFRYYASGPLQYRYSKLMERNITPILKLMSERFNKVKKMEGEKEEEWDGDGSTHVSVSPEREHLEELEGIDAKKSEKRRRKRNKKKENQGEDETEKEKEEVVKQPPPQPQKTKVEIDRTVIELSNFLEQLTIDDSLRSQCRIADSYLSRWRPVRPHPGP